MVKSVVALTMGDPGGIGPEVILKALRHRKLSSKIQYLIIGSKQPFEILKKRFGLSLPFHEVMNFDRKKWAEGKINFLNIDPEEKGFDAGKVSRRNAVLTMKALKTTAENAAAGKIQAIVTAPINKTTMRLVSPGFCGHTEYLAETSKTKHYAMMFVGKKLKVTLVTIHLPLKEVSRHITSAAVLEKIRLTHEFLVKRFRIRSPRIGVCALNPHGRETGKEEDASILPAVQKAQNARINAVGPLSADQLFHDAYEGRFDAVISMYHDQGLAPFKMICFRDGVNLTLGLPYVRTSPDHGTAFDIAYKNKADAASFISSLNLAEKLI